MHSEENTTLTGLTSLISDYDELGPLYFDDPRVIMCFTETDKENTNFRGEGDFVPQAPIKSKVKRVTRYPPAFVTVLNNKFNAELENEAILSQAHDNDICVRKIKSEGGISTICGRTVFRHEMCPYHWGLWKRENPFSNEPW